MKAFGPVPSRRLGRSLGINNIPAKNCTYSCIYCQLGTTLDLQSKRKNFYDPLEIKKEVKRKVQETRDNEVRIDYLSFVPDGEPTLEEKLGEQIDLVSTLGIDTAVISNASLIWDDSVKSDLAKADWVSLKVDAVTEKHWRKINRAHKSLSLVEILGGIEDFADQFDGTLATETMLLEDQNNSPEEVRRIANFLSQVEPDEPYIAIPTRPPAEIWAKPADEKSINKAYQIFSKNLDNVEYLIGYEGDRFSSTGNAKEDILSITSVHPMRRSGVKELLSEAGADWKVVEELIEEDELVRSEFGGDQFYLRKFPKG
ncbi:radical SAM protein [Candidatus Bipolaricaulota bacterium]|nr:radical SAM protein [Candidatus Bipolaricaulota bacterium]